MTFECWFYAHQHLEALLAQEATSIEARVILPYHPNRVNHASSANGARYAILAFTC